MNNITKVKAAYFSPTGTTQKIVEAISKTIAGKLAVPLAIDDFTLPARRQHPLVADEKTLIILGVPVYAGRVPNVIVKYIATLQGNDAIGIPVVLYGNRNYDDALIELRDSMENSGVHTYAAAAFIGEHSFSRILAANRPDKSDMDIAFRFADDAVHKLAATENLSSPISVTGETPYRPYYRPVLKDGTHADIRKVVSKVSDACTNCGICVQVCPMGSISKDDVRSYTGICIKCGACIKKCPVQARYYDDPAYLYHKETLEEIYTVRREPELFL